MSVQGAKKQFSENLRFLPSPPTSREDMEKFNLYSGLLNLAETLASIESQLASLQADVARIKNQIR